MCKCIFLDEEETPPTSSLHPDTYRYRDIMIDQYKHQPIVAVDWPPPVGQEFFGKLALLQTQDRYATHSKMQHKMFHMVRGQIDKIPQVTQDELIGIQDVLKPRDSGQSLRVIVDGPPGIGKTTLCRKLLNMWAKGELVHGKFDLVLYCPLRNDKVAQASTLSDLSVYQSPTVLKVIEWMTTTEGQGLLIIFDGWDELSTDLRQSSLAARIICREILAKCSVIVTSRSYASSSLLEMSSINRHIEVIGFSEKEIEAVVKGTLGKEPLLAKKLIKDLQVRGDVKSLCYIPLVCSIVILIYHDSDGYLPGTLTQLYEKFILETIRRHVKIRHTHNMVPMQLYSLHQLPSVLDIPFQEICRFAYLSLKENNPRMSFSSFQLQQSLNQSVKENYLGLVTTFTVHVEMSYQFLHLSIQEFLAAWWMVKYEKTEEVSAKHFEDDHFRMCLRFVAGLTNLKDKSYEEYFNKELDVGCKRRPLFGFEVCVPSHFNNQHVTKFGLPVGKFDMLLLHFLYESQNTRLCKVLSQSMKNHSLCLFDMHRGLLTLFDILCLSYFLNNSDTKWNCLDLGLISGEEIQLLTNKLMDNVQCKQLEIRVVIQDNELMTTKSLLKLFQSSFSHNLQECYIITESIITSKCLSDVTLILLELIKLEHLKMLHFSTSVKPNHLDKDYVQIDKMTLSELEKSLYDNTTLYELTIIVHNYSNRVLPVSTDIDHIVHSVIKGVTRNKSIKVFSLTWTDLSYSLPVQDKRIKHLLKDNYKLESLKLNFDHSFMPSFDITQVNVPLTALEMEYLPTPLFLQYITGINCLILHKKYPLSHLFPSHCNLQQLELSLNTDKDLIELFTILQSNSTLKALRVTIPLLGDILHSVGPSLQKMLTLNTTLAYLAIEPCMYDFPSSYFSSLITGLSCNTSLRGLNVPIRLTDTNYDQITRFFDVISQKNNFSQLKGVYNCYNEKKRQLFYEQVLPLITKMLESHTTMSHIECFIPEFTPFQPKPNWLEYAQHFWQTIFLHPSLQYVRIFKSSVMEDTIKIHLNTLIDAQKLQHPSKPLPIIELN